MFGGGVVILLLSCAWYQPSVPAQNVLWSRGVGSDSGNFSATRFNTVCTHQWVQHPSQRISRLRVLLCRQKISDDHLQSLHPSPVLHQDKEKFGQRLFSPGGRQTQKVEQGWKSLWGIWLVSLCRLYREDHSCLCGLPDILDWLWRDSSLQEPGADGQLFCWIQEYNLNGTNRHSEENWLSPSLCPLPV